MKKNTTLSEQF